MRRLTNIRFTKKAIRLSETIKMFLLISNVCIVKIKTKRDSVVCHHTYIFIIVYMSTYFSVVSAEQFTRFSTGFIFSYTKRLFYDIIILRKQPSRNEIADDGLPDMFCTWWCYQKTKWIIKKKKNCFRRLCCVIRSYLRSFIAHRYSQSDE